MNMLRSQKFHDAYITGNGQELDRLWREETPATLIKFYPAKYESNGVNYFLEHLENQTIWLSSPMMFNDPFDCVYNCDYEYEVTQIRAQVLDGFVGKEEALRMLDSEFWGEKLKSVAADFESNMHRIHKKYERNKYIACFSEKENLYSKIMWAHYANSHSGVCAEYDYTSVNAICEFGCIPIKYTDVFERSLYATTTEEGTAEFLKLIYNKATEWGYEKEWRVVKESYTDECLGFNVAFNLPKNIYLGCKISNKLKKDILEFCYGKDIGVFQMKIKAGSFFLDLEQCR